MSAIFVTIAATKFKQKLEFYTRFILLINQSEEICEKHFSDFGSRGGQISPLMPFSINFIFFLMHAGNKCIKVRAAGFEKVAVREMWRTTANYNSMKNVNE